MMTIIVFPSVHHYVIAHMRNILTSSHKDALQSSSVSPNNVSYHILQVNRHYRCPTNNMLNGFVLIDIIINTQKYTIEILIPLYISSDFIAPSVQFYQSVLQLCAHKDGGSGKASHPYTIYVLRLCHEYNIIFISPIQTNSCSPLLKSGDFVVQFIYKQVNHRYNISITLTAKY